MEFNEVNKKIKSQLEIKSNSESIIPIKYVRYFKKHTNRMDNWGLVEAATI